jgi:DNA-binding transcriptional MerR regulator
MIMETSLILNVVLGSVVLLGFIAYLIAMGLSISKVRTQLIDNERNVDETLKSLEEDLTKRLDQLDSRLDSRVDQLDNQTHQRIDEEIDNVNGRMDQIEDRTDRQENDLSRTFNEEVKILHERIEAEKANVLS